MENYNPYSLKGKTILVTGAAGGIGRATAVECSKLGAQLVLTDINEIGLQDTLNALDGDNHCYFTTDMTNQDELDTLVSSIPQIDGLVNNAGITKPSPVKFVKKEDLERIMSINTIAPICLTQKLIKKKKINDGGSLVFTVSIGGVFTTAPGNAMYGASKGALQVFVKNVALELASKIRCNSVNPGMVNTGLIKSGTYSDEDKARDMETYPMKRYGEPRDIAMAIAFLLSDASSWITGHSLIIDGGKTLY
ncbi:SDR family NAD(P)-dependent oxidoreductase [Bacteroides heparinolyticus]|uniref:SDR family NAD(P)-dependent oxidoreductase n=1 Tax=Prevotella heparinolytica TaxID=28113 RepID=UPI0023F068C2|nr:SDR family oxidoreductase [Bacteroides heparinolyticus]